MDREQTLSLWALGKDEWNGWAQRLMDERKAIETAGVWNTRIGDDGRLTPGNEPTAAWMRAASSDFSSGDRPHEFQAFDFSGWVFPGDTDFGRATFTGNAQFTGSRFLGPVAFGRARFQGFARFDGAYFGGRTWFGGTEFLGYAWFDRVTFAGRASFGGAVFSDYAYFEKAVFLQYTRFDAMRCDHAFNLAGAQFRGPPNFIQAHFVEAPRLDDLEVVGAPRILTVRRNGAR